MGFGLEAETSHQACIFHKSCAAGYCQLASPKQVWTNEPNTLLCRDIRELHRQAAKELGIDEAAKAEIERLLSELQQLLVGVSIMQDLTCRAKDSLVSFGERLSTRLFAAFLRREVLLCWLVFTWLSVALWMRQCLLVGASDICLWAL